ncbi:hypothetical protein KR067_012781 [Drosophila pandora]|nr:hypothetical protein KR067_012781 [Drosophila pandora]
MRQPSREQLLALVLASVLCLVTVSAVPLPSPAGNQELDVLQIPLANGKEIDVLTLGAKDQEQMIADRNKRTIGLLRELFPDITKEIDSIVNRIIAQVIRVAGPGLLNSVLAGNRGGAAAGGAGGRTTTPSSSFDADFDADFDDDDDDDSGSSGSASSSASPSAPATRSAVSAKANEVDESTRIKIDLPTFAPRASEAANQGDSSSENPPPLPTTTPETTTSSTSSSNPTSTTSNPTIPTTTTSSPVEALLELIPRSLEPSTTSASASATTPSTAISTTTDTDSVADLSQPPRDSTIQNPTNSIDEPLLLNIIADINRLLNSTNYFITTRDNLTATESSASTEVPTIDNNLITKLLPVFD